MKTIKKFISGAFRKAKYEIGGGKARAGKNSFPPTPFLFARLSVQFDARIADKLIRYFLKVRFWCLYRTELEPIFKTNDVARAERVVALN